MHSCPRYSPHANGGLAVNHRPQLILTRRAAAVRSRGDVMSTWRTMYSSVTTGKAPMEGRASFGFGRNTVSRTASFSLMPCPPTLLFCPCRPGALHGRRVACGVWVAPRLTLACHAQTVAREVAGWGVPQCNMGNALRALLLSRF